MRTAEDRPRKARVAFLAPSSGGEARAFLQEPARRPRAGLCAPRRRLPRGREHGPHGARPKLDGAGGRSRQPPRAGAPRPWRRPSGGCAAAGRATRPSWQYGGLGRDHVRGPAQRLARVRGVSQASCPDRRTHARCSWWALGLVLRAIVVPSSPRDARFCSVCSRRASLWGPACGRSRAGGTARRPRRVHAVWTALGLSRGGGDLDRARRG